MSYLKKFEFWEAALTRAIRTMAQAMIATIGASATLGSIDWRLVLSSSVVAALLSLLTALAGLPEVREEESK